eukprot:4277112-Prymnesium_polylepis.1
MGGRDVEPGEAAPRWDIRARRRGLITHRGIPGKTSDVTAARAVEARFAAVQPGFVPHRLG